MVLGFVEGAQRTTLLLGSPCDLGVSWVESCAPVDSALLIVEAAPERLDVNHELFARLSRIAPGAVLASNTSSIPITAIAAAHTLATVCQP